jgi:hypothetical protein
VILLRKKVYTEFDFRVIYTKKSLLLDSHVLGITPVSSVSNGLYFLTLPLVSVMRVIYTSKGMSKSLGCALSIEKYGNLLLTFSLGRQYDN